jgi:CDP-paratose 2-epimerase
MRTAVFRLSCIFGTRQFGVEDQGWISHFAISTILGRPLTIYGNGKQVRDVLYVDDLVQLFDQFIHSSLPHGVFNVGGGPGQTVSLLELLDALQDLTGRRSTVRLLDPRPSDQRIYISNTQKVEHQVGWRPRTSVSEGLQNVVAWVREHQALFEDS